MILKKPYAFLIKNFRIIHIILTILTVFIAYKSYTVASFFTNYVANNYSITITDNLVNTYISNFLYVAIILTVVALISVYILLRVKKKPNKAYLIAIIYYILLFIFIIVASYLIGSLSRGLWETADARTYRDFSNLIFYPQFIFIVILAIRALGFNVKQFDFKSDLKELEITESDNEEVELNINFEGYKVKRNIRKLSRELGYYFKENKFIIIVITVILIAAGAIYYYKQYEKVEFNYKENETINYNNVSLKIIDSMITKLDLKGNSIYKDKYFVLIKFSIKNNTNADMEWNYNSLRLIADKDFIYPKLDLGNYFLDFGDPYMGEKLKVKEEKTYIVPYLIDESEKEKDYYINIYLGSSKSKEEFKSKNAIVKLNPTRLEDVDIIRNAKVNEAISLSSTALGDASITIKNVVMTSRYEYPYQSCYKEECRTYYDVVVADTSYQNKQALIVMDYDLKLDKNSASYININDMNAFASSFMQIEYTISEMTRKSPTKYVTPAKIKDKLILQTDGYILGAEEVNLLITIRDRCYKVKIK